MKFEQQNLLSDVKDFPHLPLPRNPDSYLNLQNWVCLSWDNRAYNVCPSPQGPSRELGSQGRCLIHAVAGRGSMACSVVALLFFG